MFVHNPICEGSGGNENKSQKNALPIISMCFWALVKGTILPIFLREIFTISLPDS
jgi:hypothetical protein